jgi:hypothetical protein
MRVVHNRISHWPSGYHGAYRERRRECGLQLYKSVGVARGDTQAAERQRSENFRFFGAPMSRSSPRIENLAPTGYRLRRLCRQFRTCRTFAWRRGDRAGLHRPPIRHFGASASASVRTGWSCAAFRSAMRIPRTPRTDFEPRAPLFRRLRAGSTNELRKCSLWPPVTRWRRLRGGAESCISDESSALIGWDIPCRVQGGGAGFPRIPYEAATVIIGLESDPDSHTESEQDRTARGGPRQDIVTQA